MTRAPDNDTVADGPAAPSDTPKGDTHDDGQKAVGFLLLHAAIFILVPVIAAGIAIWWQFG